MKKSQQNPTHPHMPNIQVSSETLKLLNKTEGAMQLATGRKYSHNKCIAEMCKQIIFVTEENVKDHLRPIKLKDEST